MILNLNNSLIGNNSDISSGRWLQSSVFCEIEDEKFVVKTLLLGHQNTVVIPNIKGIKLGRDNIIFKLLDQLVQPLYNGLKLLISSRWSSSRETASLCFFLQNFLRTPLCCQSNLSIFLTPIQLLLPLIDLLCSIFGSQEALLQIPGLRSETLELLILLGWCLEAMV